MTEKINTERLITCIKHLVVSGLSSGTARIKSCCNLIGNRFEMPNVSYTQPLPPSVKNDTADNLLYKDRKRKTIKLNSQRTKQHICKSHKPTHDQNLQKSCFLADAPKPTHHPKKCRIYNDFLS